MSPSSTQRRSKCNEQWVQVHEWPTSPGGFVWPSSYLSSHHWRFSTQWPVLSSHSYQRFASFLRQGISHGFRIGVNPTFKLSTCLSSPFVGKISRQHHHQLYCIVGGVQHSCFRARQLHNGPMQSNQDYPHSRFSARQLHNGPMQSNQDYPQTSSVWKVLVDYGSVGPTWHQCEQCYSIRACIPQISHSGPSSTSDHSPHPRHMISKARPTESLLESACSLHGLPPPRNRCIP